MKKNYEWVPFFQEMSIKLLPYRQKQHVLIKILLDANIDKVADKGPSKEEIALTEIDPFSFTSLIVKHGDKRRTEILEGIKRALKISAKLPLTFRGMPTVDARQAKLFDYKPNRKKDDIDKLWNLFEEVVKKGSVSEEAFEAAKTVKWAGKAKLTQAMFRASPEKYFPIDSQTTNYLKYIRLPNKYKLVDEYNQICEELKDLNSLPLYEHSYVAWLFNNGVRVTEGDYQLAALAGAQNTKTEQVQNLDEIEGPLQKMPITIYNYPRNVKNASDAIQKAKFKCELDPKHRTFISSSKSAPYVEAHHLVPISAQESFSVSLDVVENIVALCPMCHKLLHHGQFPDKAPHLQKLLKKREQLLRNRQISVNLETLSSYYKPDLRDEDG